MDPPAAKIYVDGVAATIVAERVEYLDENGKLVTESLRDFTKRALKKRFASLDDFLKRWKSAERKQAIIEELENEGLSLEPLAEEVGKDLDPFDLICHVAFDQPPLTRRERADNVRKRDVFTKYGPQARAVLEALLAKIPGSGRDRPRRPKDSADPAASMRWGHPLQLIKEFGTRADFDVRCPRTPVRPLPEGSLSHVRSQYRQIHSRHHAPGFGVDGDAQRISQLCWMFFLKIIDDQDQQLELMQDGYRSPIPEKLRWRTWAADPEGITGEELLTFVNTELFPKLKELPVSRQSGRPPPRGAGRV